MGQKLTSIFERKNFSTLVSFLYSNSVKKCFAHRHFLLCVKTAHCIFENGIRMTKFFGLILMYFSVLYFLVLQENLFYVAGKVVALLIFVI